MPRVLIIDDDRDLRNVCRVGLEAFGHEVLTAGDAKDGLAAAAVHAPDVIVLDLGLPDMEGLDVLRRLREWTAVPIAGCSGSPRYPDKLTRPSAAGASPLSAGVRLTRVA